MSNLTFNNTELTVISQNNQFCLTSTSLAQALGYKDAKSISRIYQRNSDEFTSSMTRVVKLTTSNKNNELEHIQARIFSLRGCHLIAMFSRTKVAKEFRKWVLDLLDRQVNTHTLKINAEQQQIIKDLINQVAAQTGLTHRSLYPRLHNKFKIPRYQELPAARFDEAVQYLKAKLPKPQMFYGLDEGRYLLHVKDGSTVIRDISDKCIVDRCFVHALRQNLNLVGQQMKWLSGEGSPALLDMTVETLPG